MIRVASAAVMMGCGVEERERLCICDWMGWCRDDIEEKLEEMGVSTGIASLVLVESPLEKPGGGGVCMLSSKLFQNVVPEEFFIAWLEKVLEERRGSERSN